MSAKDFINIATALTVAGSGIDHKPIRDLRKGCGKAKRKDRKAERQNRKKARK